VDAQAGRVEELEPPDAALLDLQRPTEVREAGAGGTDHTDPGDDRTAPLATCFVEPDDRWPGFC
jgi:hypothetical protein